MEAGRRWLVGGVAVLVAALMSLSGCDRRTGDPNRDLLQALARRDEAAALKALAAGADANARESTPAPFDPQGRGHTALYLATRIHSRSLIEQLLARGADVNECYEQGGTPLMQAVGLQNVIAAEVLLERGADVGAQAADGSTALHYACLAPSDRLARLLLERGAPVNARDKAGQTPLALARIRKNQVLIRYLTSVGGKK